MCARSWLAEVDRQVLVACRRDGDTVAAGDPLWMMALWAWSTSWYLQTDRLACSVVRAVV